MIKNLLTLSNILNTYGINIQELNHLIVSANQNFTSGDVVKSLTGPFVGLEGIYKRDIDPDTAEIEFNMFGRLVLKPINKDNLLMVSKYNPNKDFKIGDVVKILSKRYQGIIGMISKILPDYEPKHPGYQVDFTSPTTKTPTHSTFSKDEIEKTTINESTTDLQKFLNTYGPEQLIKYFGPKLDELNEKDVNIFEQVLQQVISRLKPTIDLESSLENPKLLIILNFLKKYPEYLNTKIIKPETLIYWLIKFPEYGFLTKPENMYMDIISNLTSSEKYTSYVLLASSDNFKLIKDTYPNLCMMIYDQIINNYPELYFRYNLDKVFGYNDREEVAYNLFINDPVDFLELNLQIEFPNFDELEPERSVKSTEQRAAEKLLEGPTPNIWYIVYKNYHEKYPDIFNKIKYLIISDESNFNVFAYNCASLSRKGKLTEKTKDLINDVINLIISKPEGFKLLFTYNSEGVDFIEQCLSKSDILDLINEFKKHDPEGFKETKVYKSFPKLCFKIGDQVILWGKKGLIIDIDYNSNMVAVKLDNGYKEEVNFMDLKPII